MAKLQYPFVEMEIQWRAGQVGMGSNGPWVKCFAYVAKSSIENRLDSLFGPEGWSKTYEAIGNGRIFCKLSVKFGDEWITKWDGAEETQIEPFKGGCTDAFKRVAASGFGIGRYLYALDTNFAQKCSFKYEPGYLRGDLKERDQPSKIIWWSPPKLPDWCFRE